MMSVIIEGVSGTRYAFEGPFDCMDSLENRCGVYAVLCVRNNELNIIDVDESFHIKRQIECHDRKECWKRNCLGVLRYAVYYGDDNIEHSRSDVVKDIAANYYLICGG